MHHPNTPRPDTRNLIAAVVLATAIMAGWQYFYQAPRMAQMQAQKQQLQAQKAEQAKKPVVQTHAGKTKANAPAVRAPRITIRSPRLDGSISLRGGRFDDLQLAGYRETLDKNSPEVRLLAADGGKSDPYFAEFGMLASDETITMPTPTTIWQADGDTLTPETPVTLTWENGQGLTFIKRIALDKNYMFTVKLSVKNDSPGDVEFYPYGLIHRTTDDSSEHFAILHEGPLGVFGQELKELSYQNLREDGDVKQSASNGWIGVTDKYWLTAIIPDNSSIDAGFRHLTRHGRDAYQVDMRGDSVTAAQGKTAVSSMHFYAGAKEVKLLDDYSAKLNIPLFDRAVDFGMLYFLTKPMFHVLSWFYSLVGNFGIAILLLTVCIKLLMFPLANKSYTSMSQMKLLMPKMKEMQEKYKDDRMKLNQEMIALYKREKVNPASGCVPILLQIPVFFALYKVLFVTIEMRHSPFFGWIQDLSVADPTSIFNLFGLLPYAVPGFLMIGVWPCIMCATMVLQQRLNPKPTDPVQATMIQWMPFIFLFLFAGFPAGLVIYWAWNNTLSVLQQGFIMRRLERKKTAKKN
jgi:YidC/Oxa1 family membrane protein insertase